ncbi:MAG: formylglycine-generating enzyme family protein [Planctomycetota bacterium]
MFRAILALLLCQDDATAGNLGEHLEAGRNARDQGHLVKAARELYAAAKLEPRDVRLALEAAELLARVGSDAMANELVRAAEQSMSRQRTWMQSIRSLLDQRIRERVRAGNDHLRAGELALAQSEFDAAIAMDPARGELYVHRAGTLNLLGDRDGALAALGEALHAGLFDRQKFIEVPPLQTLWSDVRYRELLRDAFGEGTVTMAAQYWHDQAGARVRRGIAALHRGAAAAALAEFANAVQIEPEDAELYVFEARAQALLELRAAALDSLKQAFAHGFTDRDRLLEFPVLRTLVQEHLDELLPPAAEGDAQSPPAAGPPAATGDAEEPAAPAVPGFTHQGKNAKGRPEYQHDATGVMFVLVPGRDLEGGDDTHVTPIKPFLIAKHEITQAVWQQAMGSNPSHFVDASRPVDSVLFGEALRFCKRFDLTLPTEAEWEHACRAGAGAVPASELEQLAWYGQTETQAVATKQSNAWGLYDLLGNVWEWCQGEIDDKPGSVVARGGSYSSGAADCTPDARSAFKRGTRHASVGFRPVRVLDD